MSTSTDNWEQVKLQSCDALGEDIVELINNVLEGPHSDSQLIAVLHAVQEKFGYLAEPQLDAVAQLMQIPVAKVSGVASFYHFFRLKPGGRYTIKVCMGTACYVKGADRIVQKLTEELGTTFGETTPDGMFALEGARCLGTCGMAPVIMVNDELYGNVTPEGIPALIKKYIKEARDSEQA